MARPIRNMGASVRARLLTTAKERNQPFQLLLTRLERLLHRLVQTPHHKRLALKGAMLVTTWFDNPHRPTRDMDFLGFGDPDPEAMLKIFREVCDVTADDGVEFDPTELRVDQIREELEYGGLRLRTIATVAGARVNVVIDIGFGDAIEPGLQEVELPVLLDQPAPRLQAYARETVIAEKFQAMVMVGRANSRLKDFYDIWSLSRSYDFEGSRLARALAATFERRKTALPTELPDALTSTFAQDPMKRQQWEALLRDISGQATSLEEVVRDLASFSYAACRAGTRILIWPTWANVPSISCCLTISEALAARWSWYTSPNFA
jgi:predicted nucleotidyltransferase component of viral defense system